MNSKMVTINTCDVQEATNKHLNEIMKTIYDSKTEFNKEIGTVTRTQLK